MKNDSQKYLIDAVPLIRLPLDHEPAFTYLSQGPIPEGSYVAVEFFRRKIPAVVIRCHRDFERFSSIRLKTVEQIISPALLTAKQLQLARFMSDEYFTPLGICLKSFIPKMAKIKTETRPENNPIEKIKLPLKKKKVLEKMIGSKSNCNFSIDGFPDNGKFEEYCLIAKISLPYQTLICNPEILTSYQCFREISRYFPRDQIAYLSGQLSVGEFYRHWEDIRSGKIKIIIGTRISLFAPFSNLKAVVINDSQDSSYKQWDMAPRYDSRVVAKGLANIHRSKIFFQSSFPLLVDQVSRNTNSHLDEKFTNPKKNQFLPQVEIINMKLEWKNGKLRSPISAPLEKMVGQALEQKKQTVILLNQQGMTRFSICANCKKVIRCPKCGRALNLKKSGVFSCPSCAYSTSLSPTCPTCKGLVFKNYGFGIDKIEKELKKFFPSARIATASSPQMRKEGGVEELYQSFIDGKIDILIGTQIAIKAWKIPKLSLAAIIDADNLYNFPEFNSRELFWDDFIQCANRVSLEPGGKIAIQTYHPEEKIFQWAQNFNSNQFYQDELKNRQSLKYPPYFRLIKVSFRHKNPQLAEKEIAGLLEKLKDDSTAEIISQPFVPRKQPRLANERSLLIKCPADKLSPKILRLIRKLPSGWMIDADPINIT